MSSSTISASPDDRLAALQRAVGPTIEVRGLIGRGGFAEVYAAWDQRLKRGLAIKTLRSDIVVSSALLRRFQREAEAIAKLRHPNIVPVYTVGEGEGLAYFVMPRIEGESLAAVLANEDRLPVREACRVLREAASALAAAHRAGIVHRDVKPDNIMLEGPDRRALVMDFGISKTLDAADAGLTGTGMVMGTPQFMSPEQAAGEGEIDHRSDQYSLAIVGYCMLAGRPPFEGGSPQTVLYRQVTQSPRPIREHNPDVPEAVAAAIERALAKRPDDRFPSMEAFEAAIAAADDSRPAKATWRRVDTLGARLKAARRSLPRRAAPIVLLAALSAVLFVGLYPLAQPTVGYRLAGERDEAIFAARSYLAGRGADGPFTQRYVLEGRDSLFRFLGERLGPAGLERRARADVPVWAWRFTLRRRADDAIFTVDVMPGGRVSYFRHHLPDSATAPAVSDSAALALAAGELAARGWRPESLVRLPDSTRRLPNRTDHVFTWRRPGASLAWRGTDSLHSLVRVRVSGTAVTHYELATELPAAWTRARRPPPALLVLRAVGWVLMIAAAVVAITTAVSRQRTDDLQWWAAWRIAVPFAAGFGVIIAPMMILDQVLRPPDAPAINQFDLGGLAFLLAIMIAVFGASSLFATVSGESLSAQHRPASAAGLLDVARGHLRVPEMAVAAARGYALAALALGATTVAAVGWLLAAGVPGDAGVHEVFDRALPAMDPVSTLLRAPAYAMAVVFLHLRLVGWRGGPWLAVLAPVALSLLPTLGMESQSAVDYAETTAIALAISYGAWRYGWLTGAVTMFVAYAAWPTLALLRSGTADLATSGVVALALLLLPAALGVASHRRLPPLAPGALDTP